MSKRSESFDAFTTFNAVSVLFGVLSVVGVGLPVFGMLQESIGVYHALAAAGGLSVVAYAAAGLLMRYMDKGYENAISDLKNPSQE